MSREYAEFELQPSIRAYIELQQQNIITTNLICVMRAGLRYKQPYTLANKHTAQMLCRLLC